MAEQKPKDLVALRRIQVPKEGSKENDVVEPGSEFTPISKASAERLERIGAAAEPGSKEAKAAKRRAKADEDDDE